MDQKLSEVEAAAQAAERMSKAIAYLKKRVAKGNPFRLSPVLNKRRKEHLIPDGAFAAAAGYDRVFLYQIAEKDLTGDATYGDTLILMPESVKRRSTEENPRGIVISAGLKALDELRSHGMDVGHIVRFQRLTPYRFICDNVHGKDVAVLVMYASHITGSEDLAREIHSGEMRATWDVGIAQHVWTRRGKRLNAPTKGWQPTEE